MKSKQASSKKIMVQGKAVALGSGAPAPSLAPTGIPSRMPAVLEYVQRVSLDPGAALAYNTWNMNSLYDPDQTGTGHQPCGFDTMAAMFSRYLVTSAKLTATFIPTSGYATATIYGANLYTGSTPYNTGASTQCEQGGPYIISSGTKINQGGGRNVISINFDARKYFGVKDPFDAQGDLGALTNSNPTRRAYTQVWCGPADESTDIPATEVVVHIKYNVVFYDPLQVGSS